MACPLLLRLRPEVEARSDTRALTGRLTCAGYPLGRARDRPERAARYGESAEAISPRPSWALRRRLLTAVVGELAARADVGHRHPDTRPVTTEAAVAAATDEASTKTCCT